MNGSADSKRVTNQRFHADEVGACGNALCRSHRCGGRPPEGFVVHAEVARFAAHGRYLKSEMRKDLFDGAIAACRTVEEPRLCDLSLDRNAAWRRSISHRIAAAIEADSFVGTHSVKLLLDELWPGRAQKRDIRANRQIRASGIVRFRNVRNTTSGRDRPL